MLTTNRRLIAVISSPANNTRGHCLQVRTEAFLASLSSEEVHLLTELLLWKRQAASDWLTERGQPRRMARAIRVVTSL